MDHTATSTYADEDDNMQVLEQQPAARERLTPLPDFVTSYHNPQGETFTTLHNGAPSGSGGELRDGMQSRRLTRRVSSLSRQKQGEDTGAVDRGMLLGTGGQGGYVSRRKIHGVEMSEPIKAGSSDERRAMSDGMVSLLREKMQDLRGIMDRANAILPTDLEAGKGDEVFNLAIEYLHQSDHDGPAGSRRLQSGLLRKVDSLGKLAKRLDREIPADVDRDSDMYDLRSYYRGHRGVDIFGGSSLGASRKRATSQLDVRPDSASSEFRQALTSLDPSQFQPEGSASSPGGGGGGGGQDNADDNDFFASADDDDYRESQSEGGSSSLAMGRTSHNGTRLKRTGSRTDLSNLTLSLARKQLVRMQDDKRRRAVARRQSNARKQRNTLNRLAESFAIRALPDPKMVYRLGKLKPPLVVDVKLILGYVADSMRIVEGTHAERVFRNYFLGAMARRAFSLTFWQAYLRCFQHPVMLAERRTKAQAEAKERKRAAQAADVQVDSEKERCARMQLVKDLEQDKLDQKADIEEMDELLAATYVGLLSSIKVETHKPVFHRYFGLALAEAIYQTFYFYCPGSRNLYDNKFKRVLYQKVADTMTGMPMYPVSAAIMSAAVFGDVIIDEGPVPVRNPPEPLPAGHATKPMRFPEPSIWIPAGKRTKAAAKPVVTHMSPLVRKFLGKPQLKGAHPGPLPGRRSKPTTTRYRLPNAFKMIHLAEDKMMELRANYDFKMNQFSSDQKFDRKAVLGETRNLEKLKQKVLGGSINERQRYAFHILDVHKKAAQGAQRQAELNRL